MKKGRLWTIKQTGTDIHPFSGLVFQEGFDDGVHGMNIPRLIHEMDSAEPSRKTVLRRQSGPFNKHRISTKQVGVHHEPTWSPSMASLRMLGVSLEACLKEKLLQSMIRMKPLICSSGFSIRTSRESRMARRISMKEFLLESSY